MQVTQSLAAGPVPCRRIFTRRQKRRRRRMALAVVAGVNLAAWALTGTGFTPF